MKMFYLVYLPSMMVLHADDTVASCLAALRDKYKVSEQEDEDYQVMTDQDFIDGIREIYS